MWCNWGFPVIAEIMTKHTGLFTQRNCSRGVLILLKFYWAPDIVKFVLGTFSHFYIAIAYSNSTFCGTWTPIFCEFTWKLSKFQQNEHTPGVSSFRWNLAVFNRKGFHTSIVMLWEKQSRRTWICTLTSKTSTPLLYKWRECCVMSYVYNAHEKAERLCLVVGTIQ